MSETIEFAEREDVKELAQRISLLIPGVQDLGAYKDAGALALAQAAITSGLNPFLGEIWVLRKGRGGEACKGFSIKPGIRGARRAARNQAATWGLIPPYYRPMFRVPTEFEGQLMGSKAGDAAVACDLELLLPLEHPWYKDAGGDRYIVTGLGIDRKGGRSQMHPFQAARKRAEEDALKLAFDLPMYGEDEPENPSIQELYPAAPQAAVGNPQDQVTPVKGPDTTVSRSEIEAGITVEVGAMPDFSQCGPNFWNNMTADLVKAGLIPSAAWLLHRFRLMGVTHVNEVNAQDLVDKALERYGNDLEQAPEEPADIIKEDAPAETEAVGSHQVETETGEIVGPARPMTPAGVTAMVQEKLKAARDKWGDKEATKAQLATYTFVIGGLTRDPGEEADLLFYLLFSKDVGVLVRAELSALFGWCLDPQAKEGVYHLNEWAVEEARTIIDMMVAREEKAKEAVEAQAAEHEAEAIPEDVEASEEDAGIESTPNSEPNPLFEEWQELKDGEDAQE